MDLTRGSKNFWEILSNLHNNVQINKYTELKENNIY